MAYTPIDTDNAEFQNALKLIQYTRQSVFLTGKAGTGKSTFLKHVCQITKKKFVVLAPTGIAAINAGGSTLHSFFKLPFFQTQFIGLYSLSSFLLAGIGYLIAKEIYNKRLFINLSLFFLFFIGDISHLITYILQRKFIFTILSLANDATRFNNTTKPKS